MDEEEIDRLVEYGEDVTAVIRKPTSARPWRCPECRARMSYKHTYDAHVAGHRVGQAPATRRLGQSTGGIRCGVEGCSAAYDSVLERDMHHQARHPRSLFT